MATALADLERLDFSPDTQVIEYMRKQNLSWHIVLKELIDNAIDASATMIWIDIHVGRRVRITDNGGGCNNLWPMITLGRRVEHPGTQIGQNGVGLKDAAIWLANALKIRSVQEGMAREVMVHWNDVLAKGEWMLEKPILPRHTEEPNGTTIELTDLRKGRPDRQQLIEHLGQTYRPALEQGCQLWIKFSRDKAFTPIPPFPYPALLHEQTESLDISGKQVRVTIGMIPPESPFQGRGLLYIYGPRVIVSNRRSGIAPEAVSELFGWVEFAKDWVLEKNKIDFLEDLTPLEDAITERFADLLVRASRHHVAQPLEDISKLINERLKAFRLTQGPPRRGRRDGPHIKEGTQEPTGDGTPHGRARKVQPGDTFRLERFVSMHYAALGAEGDICKVNDDVLLINRESPFIAEAMENPQQLERIIVFAIATHLGTAWEQQQLIFPWAGESGGIADRIFKIVKILSGMGHARLTVSPSAA